MSRAVTVIIPTLNAGQELPALLQALRSQTVSCELLVVDSSSTDNTAAAASSFGARVLTVLRHEFDHGGTRTMAARNAQGDILVFLTQDAVPADNRAVENLIRSFETREIGAAYGRQLPSRGASPFAEHLRLFKYPERPCVRSIRDRNVYGIETPFLSNSFSAYRKEALQEIGFFKQGVLFAEDVHAGARLIQEGYSIAYVPDAMVYHSHNHTPAEEFKRYFDTAVFYANESWIGRAFGRNRGEAWRYTTSEFRYAWERGGALLALESLGRTAMRVSGFAFGRMHSVLPGRFCQTLSAHPGWWEKRRSA